VVDESAIAVSAREVPVQVNGKLRTRVIVHADASPSEIEAAVLADPKIVAILNGRTPDRIVVAGGGKLVNIVLRD
jgi:leucyl-tRNA synthetase